MYVNGGIELREMGYIYACKLLFFKYMAGSKTKRNRKKQKMKTTQKRPNTWGLLVSFLTVYDKKRNQGTLVPAFQCSCVIQVIGREGLREMGYS